MEVVTWDVGGDLMWGEGRSQGSRTQTLLFLILALKAQSLEYIAQGSEALGDEDGGFE